MLTIHLQKHPNVKFTHDCESDGELSFLDVLIKRNGSSFSTSVFRKDTFSGQGLSYFSECSDIFKINSIKTLIFRAYMVCSSNSAMSLEFEFLRNFYQNNGFPSFLFEKCLGSFLNSKYTKKPPQLTCLKKKMFISIPYLGNLSVGLKKELMTCMMKYFPHVNAQFVQTNKFTIASLFPFKDTLPKELMSGLVYHYSCAKCDIASYIGYTTRSLKIRILEHRGRSYRSYELLSDPSHSAIREHAERCNCFIELDNFKILASSNSEMDLKILESLHIKKSDPNLNRMKTSYPLKIVE